VGEREKGEHNREEKDDRRDEMGGNRNCDEVTELG
jgi:hypothetical protein